MTLQLPTCPGRPNFLRTRAAFAIFVSLAFGMTEIHAQFVAANYDFSAGAADSTGNQASLMLQGAAAVSGGKLILHDLADKATVNIPNTALYATGVQAIELEAKFHVNAFKGYGVAAAEIIKLNCGWDAQMMVVQDKWGAKPLIRSGAGREVVSAAVLNPYWPLGMEHHVRIILDVHQSRVWIDGRLINTITATGDLAKWNRSGVTSLVMGSFDGTIDNVVMRRWATIPSYPDLSTPPTITSLIRNTDGTIQIIFDSNPGQYYTVETSPDGVTWTAQADTITLASALSTTLLMETEDSATLQVRVTAGNAFTGQGPLMVSHAVGSTLLGSSTTFAWNANEVGVEEWQVLAGSTLGGSQYFQSFGIPGTSTQYPVTGLPTSGEDVHVTLRYRKGTLWAEKKFLFHAAQTDGLPVDREGIYPVAQGDYHGVEQILVLSNRWIIVAVTDVKEVLDRVNTLSSGAFNTQVKNWMGSEPAGNPPNWTAYTGQSNVRDTYIAQARVDLNEARYTDTTYYAISSADASAYSTALAPTKASQYYVGLDKGQIPGAHPLHYAHYCYLELPEAMVSGKHYTITLDDGKYATFLYDELRTVSRAIKVNQAGYLPDAGKKYAYMGAYVHGEGPLPLAHATTFNVINAATGDVALTGTVTLREANPRFSVTSSSPDPATRPYMHGEDLYQIDLSDLEEEGNFFISVPGVGRSWTFRHHADAYGEPFYIAARGLFHQRASMRYNLPYTPFSRAKAHSEAIFESGLVAFGFGTFNPPSPYEVFDIVGGSIDYNQATENVLGGWYDAADWDRNIKHYTCIFDLLNAYELAPAKFTDGGLNIPESGNGIPDILDEAEYGLEVWTRSMDAGGGVSGFVETFMHPSMTDPAAKYAYSRRTRWSSLIYAAAAAQYAELIAPFNSTKSAAYRLLAERAFEYGNDPANSLGEALIPAKHNRGTGTAYNFEWTEQDSYLQPYLFHAKLRLYLLTQDSDCLTGIQDHLATGATPWAWPNTYKDCVSWFYFAIAHRGAAIFPSSLVTHWKNKFINEANVLLGQVENMGYRHTWPRHQDYWLAWGESNMANRGRVLLQAYALTQNAAYRDAAICNMDYMLGTNPMGMSWTTGIGAAYPAVFQHAVSELDGIDDPVPGLTLYGLDGAPMNYVLRDQVWKSPDNPSVTSSTTFFTDPAVPFYRRWMAHPTLNVGQCEFTIHETVSATIFSCAMLAPDGWTPSTALKERKPRNKKSLYGYWYLP